MRCEQAKPGYRLQDYGGFHQYPRACADVNIYRVAGAPDTGYHDFPDYQQYFQLPLPDRQQHDTGASRDYRVRLGSKSNMTPL